MFPATLNFLFIWIEKLSFTRSRWIYQQAHGFISNYFNSSLYSHLLLNPSQEWMFFSIAFSFLGWGFSLRFFDHHLSDDFDALLFIEFILVLELFLDDFIELFGLELVTASVFAKSVDRLLTDLLKVLLAHFCVTIRIDRVPLTEELILNLLRRVNTFLVHVRNGLICCTTASWFAHASHSLSLVSKEIRFVLNYKFVVWTLL